MGKVVNMFLETPEPIRETQAEEVDPDLPSQRNRVSTENSSRISPKLLCEAFNAALEEAQTSMIYAFEDFGSNDLGSTALALAHHEPEPMNVKIFGGRKNSLRNAVRKELIRTLPTHLLIETVVEHTMIHLSVDDRLSFGRQSSLVAHLEKKQFRERRLEKRISQMAYALLLEPPANN